MPLSHEEEERFAALEQAFYDSDPRRVRRIRRVTASIDAGVTPRQTRNRRLAAAGLVLGAVLVASFAFSVLVAMAGFVVMVVSVAYLIGELARAAALASKKAKDRRASQQTESAESTVPDDE